MGQALYRKHRSRGFDEVIGQDHITTTLKNAIKEGKVSHAYLFTGPKGVGKTSVARILAHEVNKLAYNNDVAHLDIVEIDAASNRRIDEIRDLRDKVHIAPTSSKYKVYIIDEVHMLTKEAFNALLKTLEEPPAHVIFILATTEAHKLPSTIISRTQRFVFKPIDNIVAVKHLKTVAKKEGINISDDALEMIAEHGDGSFRDSISLLDQLSGTSDSISEKDVELMLGLAPKELTDKLIIAMDSKNPKSLMKLLEDFKVQGYHSATLAKTLATHYRDKALSRAGDSKSILRLLHRLIGVPSSLDPGQKLELILLEQILTDGDTEQRASNINPVVTKQPISTKNTSTSVEKKPSIEQSSKVKTKSKNLVSKEDDWQKILSDIKNQHSTLYSTLRMAEPLWNKPDQLELRFKFSFHVKRLKEAKNQSIIQTTVDKVVGTSVQIKFNSGEGAPVKIKSKVSSVDKGVEDEQLETISNIFGGGEMLES